MINLFMNILAGCVTSMMVSRMMKDWNLIIPLLIFLIPEFLLTGFYYPVYEGFIGLFSCFTVFLVLVAYGKEKSYLNIMINSCIWYFLKIIAMNVVIALSYVVFQFNIIQSYIIYRLLSIGLYTMIYYGYNLIFDVYNVEEHRYAEIIHILIILISFSLFNVLNQLYIYDYFKVSILIFGLFILDITFYSILFLLIKAENKQQELETQAAMNFIEKKNYERMMDINEEVLSFKHDIKKTLLYLCNLLKNKEYTKALNLLEEQSAVVNNFQTTIQSGNSMLDFILNSRMNIIKKENIIFHYTILSNRLSISDVDSNILIGNALDNAINYCIENRGCSIDFYTRETRGMFIIEVVNDIVSPVIMKDTYPTNQNSAYAHGYGISNMKYIVEKNNGRLKYKECDNKLSCYIILPL